MRHAFHVMTFAAGPGGKSWAFFCFNGHRGASLNETAMTRVRCRGVEEPSSRSAANSIYGRDVSLRKPAQVCNIVACPSWVCDIRHMRRQIRQAAESMLLKAGARVTRARGEVLAVLLGAERALTHHEVEQRISGSPAIDRVTVYRVLDWLTGQGLAHRISGSDRVWRYNATEHAHAQAHAHFHCARCGTVVCLDELDERSRVRVPKGFVLHEVVLTAKGFCATCAHAESSGRRHGDRAAH